MQHHTTQTDRIGKTLTSLEAVRVIAIVDGIGSASAWLDNTHPDATSAVFYRAVKIGDHPDMICGGVYAAIDKMVFLTGEGQQ